MPTANDDRFAEVGTFAPRGARSPGAPTGA
jgi:hypothetical protein